MKVFMSWSGLRSKLTAELLHDWIKCVIQAAQPWISSKGIERGALWFSEINNELKDTSVGIICITQENKKAPWILFESGALAKGLSTNRVCTFLVDLQTPDLEPPLAQFNHTFPTKESMWSLVVTLNNSLEDNRLDQATLDRVFETYWPKFEADFASIIAENPPVTVIAPREEKDILTEILETTRNMSSRIRTLELRDKQPASSRFKTHHPHNIPRTFDEFVAEEKLRYGEGISLAINLLRSGLTAEEVQSALMMESQITSKLAREIVDSAELIGVSTSKPTPTSN